MKRLCRHPSVMLCTAVLMLAVNPLAAVGTSLYSVTGTVLDGAKQPLEGVLISLRSEEREQLVSVASNAQGQFRFPRSRLPAGDYRLSVRATGFTLATNQIKTVSVEDQTIKLPVSLESTTDRSILAAQLTSLEWLQSWPGSNDDKRAMMHNLVNCMFCHSLERIARSRYDAEAFMGVIQRMLTYETDHSSAERIQVVSLPQSLKGLSWFGTDARRIARYLASVNLRDGDDWPYDFDVLPRPTGAGTQAVVTVIPIPRPNSVIHDLDVDAQGRVWYGNTGWDYLGMYDPRSGEFSEWQAPNFLPEAPEGTDRILGVQDIQVDHRGHVWAAVGGTKLARFIPDTEKWQVFDLPVIWRNPFLSPVRPGEEGIWATGLAGIPEGHQRHETAYRLDIESGKLSQGINLFDHMPPPDDPLHDNPLNYCYMMDQDTNGDFLCTAPVPSGIVRASQATGKSTFYPTPTRHAYPRRGYRDEENRFWFSEFYADRIGVMDLNTNTFTEYPLAPEFISPYYARPDGRGYVWSSSTGSDRLLRLDPDTGAFDTFLMPVYYDARKVVVDESASHTVVWLPNKNSAELIRVELLDELVPSH